MRNWIMTIDVSGFWDKGKDGSTSIEEFCKQFHKILISYTDRIKKLISDQDEIYNWNELLEELEYANFENWAEFNYWLDGFYDFLDYNDIWLNTF